MSFRVGLGCGAAYTVRGKLSTTHVVAVMFIVVMVMVVMMMMMV